MDKYIPKVGERVRIVKALGTGNPKLAGEEFDVDYVGPEGSYPDLPDTYVRLSGNDKFRASFTLGARFFQFEPVKYIPKEGERVLISGVFGKGNPALVGQAFNVDRVFSDRRMGVDDTYIDLSGNDKNPNFTAGARFFQFEPVQRSEPMTEEKAVAALSAFAKLRAEQTFGGKLSDNLAQSRSGFFGLAEMYGTPDEDEDEDEDFPDFPYIDESDAIPCPGALFQVAEGPQAGKVLECLSITVNAREVNGKGAAWNFNADKTEFIAPQPPKAEPEKPYWPTKVGEKFRVLP